MISRKFKGGVQLLGLMNDDKGGNYEMVNRVYSIKGICPTIRTYCGGGHEAKILCKKKKH